MIILKTLKAVHNTIRPFSWYLLCVISGIVHPVFSGEKDQDIVNQLYHEILSASSGKVDSTPVSEKSLPLVDDSVSTIEQHQATQESEQVQKAIDKIIKDVQLRHSATVKFMQDN